MNRAPLWLMGLWVGTNVVLVQQAVVAKSPQEVARVAKTITDYGSDQDGSWAGRSRK